MRRNIFSSFASFHTGFAVLSLFSFFAFPSLQLASTTPTESVMTEYGSNYPWRVDEGETMKSIADKWYGDDSFWITLWNDNPWIEDPSQIEEDWVLEVRSEKPILPGVLKPELAIYAPKVGYAQPRVATRALPVSKPVVVTAPKAITYAGGPLNEAQITYLGQCEAGMDPAKNTGNGYYGAFQFSYGTWNSMGTGYERADMAPIEVQKDAVQRLLSRSSIFTQFPGCARKMQSLGML